MLAPSALAGLARGFAKVTVIDSLLDGDALWPAVIVALSAVIGLVYCVRFAAVLFRAGGHRAPGESARTPWLVALALTVAATLGFMPQPVPSTVGGQPRTCSPKPVRPVGSSPSFRCSEGIS